MSAIALIHNHERHNIQVVTVYQDEELKLKRIHEVLANDINSNISIKNFNWRYLSVCYKYSRHDVLASSELAWNCSRHGDVP
jgi:hypothetical protein